MLKKGFSPDVSLTSQANVLMLWNLFNDNAAEEPSLMEMNIGLLGAHTCGLTDYVEIKVKEAFRLSNLETAYVCFMWDDP